MKSSKSFFKTPLILGCGSLGGLHALNLYLKKRKTASHLLGTDRGQFYPWQHGNVFYRKYGDGEIPLLLLHSVSETSCSYEWHAVTNTLAKRFHVYVVDLPGCGRSDKNAHEYTNYLYVSFVTSFLRDVVGKPAVIVASGMAAAVAVTAAHADPSAVSGIILINPPSTEMLAQVPDQKSTLLRRLVATPIIGECLYHILTSRRELEYLYQEKIFYNPFRLDEKTVTVLQEAACSGKGSGRYLRASLDGRLMNWNINRILGLLTCNVDLIFSEKLPETIKDSASYQEHCPNANIHIIPSVGVLPQLEKPEAFCEVMRSCRSLQGK